MQIPFKTRVWAMSKVADAYWYDILLMRAEKMGHDFDPKWRPRECRHCGLAIEWCEDNRCRHNEHYPDEGWQEEA